MSSVLLLDDDDEVVRSYARVLAGAGYAVDTGRDAREIIGRLAPGVYDVIVTDVSMPVAGGLDLLRAVRARDLDVPVILMTGSPTIEHAVRAVDDGAFRWLDKPVAPAALLEAVALAARLHDLARARRDALAFAAAEEERTGAMVTMTPGFEAALAGLWMAFQPIVSLREKRVVGYEALLRTAEATLARPDRFLDAAEKLGRLRDLGRRVRGAIAAAAAQAPRGAWIFVNLHASDLADEEIYDARTPLSAIAASVILEITERASLVGVADVPAKMRALRALGFRIALDDLGAGYAGLTTLTQIEPEIVKLDMSLVRDVHRHAAKQAVVRTMTALCGGLGMSIVAEGVETAEERDAMAGMGCDFLQGFFFARPDRGFAVLDL